MSVITYEGRIEHGQIRLKDAPVLPEGAQVYLVVNPAHSAGDSEWARKLYELFTPARQEAASYSEEEVNSDIDAAIAAVRGKHA